MVLAAHRTEAEDPGSAAEGRRCLVVGAGPSELSFDLRDGAEAGTKDIASVAVSQVAARHMKAFGDRKGCKHQSSPTLVAAPTLSLPRARWARCCALSTGKR